MQGDLTREGSVSFTACRTCAAFACRKPVCVRPVVMNWRVLILLLINGLALAGDVRLHGSSIASVEANGDVRVHGSIVGRFEANGDIRVRGSVIGRIESGGTIRQKGSIVGQVESNGDVRKHGSIIGRIEKNGDVRERGSIIGKVSGVPCEQAAVLFFFDFFSVR